MRNANEAYERRTEILAKGLDLDQLIMIVAKYLDLDADLIVRKGRKRSIALARSIICALAADRLMFSNTDIARRLHITASAVSKLVARGREVSILHEVEVNIFGE